jgi:hypothetical protein
VWKKAAMRWLYLRRGDFTPELEAIDVTIRSNSRAGRPLPPVASAVSLPARLHGCRFR